MERSRCTTPRLAIQVVCVEALSCPPVQHTQRERCLPLLPLSFFSLRDCVFSPRPRILAFESRRLEAKLHSLSPGESARGGSFEYVQVAQRVW